MTLPPHTGRAVALLLPLAALSILAQGFQLPGNGNSYHWPILFGWVGSDAGPTDAFTDSLAHYVSQFWRALGPVATEENVGWLFWLLHYALRLLHVGALALLIRRLGGATLPHATLLAGLVVIVLQWFRISPLGHGEVLLDSVSNATATTSLALVFFWLVVEARWRWAALVVGLGFNISAFSFAWCGLLLLAAWLADGKREWRTFAWMAALAALPALPTVWWIAETIEATRPQLPPYDFRTYLVEFYPGHVIAGASRPESALGLLFLALGLAFLHDFDGRLQRRLRALYAAICLILLLGLLLPHLTAGRLLLNLVPLRMDFLLVWLVLAMAAARLVVWRRDGSWGNDAAVFGTLASGAWLAFACLQADSSDRRIRRALLLCLAALPLLFWALPAMEQLTDRFTGALLLAGALALLALTNVQRTDAQRLSLLGFLAALQYGAVTAQMAWAPPLASAAVLLLWLADRQQRVVWIGIALLLAVGLALQEGATRPSLLLLSGIALPAVGRWLLTLPPAALFRHLRNATPLLVIALALVPMAANLAQGGRFDRYDDRAAAFLELQRWARAETPPHSLFLQPDEQLRANGTPSFWTLSRRPAWVDWRQGAAALWQPDFYWQWHERMAEATALETVAEKLAYARDKDIPYIVVSAEERLPESASLPLYDDGHWRVLAAD